jgi:hypothetical protein
VRGPAGEHQVEYAGAAQAAGPYAGWNERAPGRAAVVFDAGAGREVARFAGADLVDLQADGKVLLRTADGGAAWSSAQDPQLRRLPLQLGPIGTRARLDGDRILVARRAAPGGLDLIGLDGSRRTVVDLRGRELLTADFDLAGDRVAGRGRPARVRRSVSIASTTPSGSSPGGAVRPGWRGRRGSSHRPPTRSWRACRSGARKGRAPRAEACA